MSVTQERDSLATANAKMAADRSDLEAKLTALAGEKASLAQEVLQAQKDVLALIETAKSKGDSDSQLAKVTQDRDKGQEENRALAAELSANKIKLDQVGIL